MVLPLRGELEGGLLVVEQSHVSEGHGHIVFVAGLDDIVVTDAAAGLCDVLHATLVGALDVVAEGEESIGAQAYVGVPVSYTHLTLPTICSV